MRTMERPRPARRPQPNSADATNPMSGAGRGTPAGAARPFFEPLTDEMRPWYVAVRRTCHKEHANMGASWHNTALRTIREIQRDHGATLEQVELFGAWWEGEFWPGTIPHPQQVAQYWPDFLRLKWEPLEGERAAEALDERNRLASERRWQEHLRYEREEAPLDIAEARERNERRRVEEAEETRRKTADQQRQRLHAVGLGEAEIETWGLPLPDREFTARYWPLMQAYMTREFGVAPKDRT